MVSLGLFLANLVLIMHGCCILVGVGTDTVSPLALARVATVSFLLLCLNSLVIRKERFLSFLLALSSFVTPPPLFL